MVFQWFIAEINIATLHAPGEQSTVSIFYYFFGKPLGFYRVIAGINASDGTVCSRTFCDIRNNLTVFVPQVVSDDNANIIQFQALASVDTTNFVY